MKNTYLFATLIAATLTASADEWQPIGMATVVDGWITPGYVDDSGKQIDPSLYPFEVEVHESTATPGVYKLINPFGSKDFHLSEFNLDGTASDIVIDARDRSLVIIQPQYCGFTDADASEPTGQYKYYISDMGTYMWNLGQQRETINALKCASTMTGNVITVRQPTFGTTPDRAIQAWDPSYSAMIILPDNSEEDDSKWESVGIAEVTDGWILPGWTDESGRAINPADYPFSCELQFNLDNPDIYCLVDPFHSIDYPLVPFNLSNSRPRIVIDATDPDLVLVKTQFSGFIARKDNDISPYYITEAGHILSQRGDTPEQITRNGHNATFAGGVITIPTPLFDFDITGTGKQWNTPAATIIRMPGAGVSDINTDADLPVTYYNLQGIPVANPEPGHIYIRQKGHCSEKIIF